MQSLDGENLVCMGFTPASWTWIYGSNVFWHMILPHGGFDQIVIYLFLYLHLCLFNILTGQSAAV